MGRLAFIGNTLSERCSDFEFLGKPEDVLNFLSRVLLLAQYLVTAISLILQVSIFFQPTLQFPGQLGSRISLVF